MLVDQNALPVAAALHRVSRTLQALVWYAAYTRPRHEKRVAEELVRRDVEAYVPLYETARLWKNGRHFVRVPLFPGYAFVRIALCDRLNVLRVPGVVNLVEFSGKPAPVEEVEIEGLKRALSQGRNVEPHPFVTEGQKVRITSGPLTGLQGIVTRRKARMHVVVTIELIQRSVSVEIDSMEVEPQI